MTGDRADLDCLHARQIEVDRRSWIGQDDGGLAAHLGQNLSHGKN